MFSAVVDLGPGGSRPGGLACSLRVGYTKTSDADAQYNHPNFEIRSLSLYETADAIWETERCKVCFALRFGDGCQVTGGLSRVAPLHTGCTTRYSGGYVIAVAQGLD